MLNKLNKEKSQILQDDIITHCDGLPDDLITELCDVVIKHTQCIEEN